MAQTKQDVEKQLAKYQAMNPDWYTDVDKGRVVASFNNRLASFVERGTPFFLSSDQIILILIVFFFLSSGPTESVPSGE